MQNGRTAVIRRTVTIFLLVIGAILVIFSVAVELVGLDFTDGFGIVQMAQLLVGLTCLTISAFLHIHSLRAPDTPRSLQADIGIRLAATGLVFAYVAGFSDLLQIGTHVGPNFERPYFGPWQLSGIVVGIVVIVAGMLLYHTSRGVRPASSLSFLFGRKQPPPQPVPETAVSAETAADPE